MTSSRKQEGFESLFRGKSKEQLAAGTFAQWLWITARPEPDVGADLVVEIPARGDAAGASFTIQLRSHKTNVRTETIKRASAERLQRSVLPVFVLSIHNGSGRVRWRCIESLFDTEPTYLSGGDLKVQLLDSQAFALTDLLPPADFVSAIYQAKARGGLKATPSLRLHAQAIQDKYRAIDTRLVVLASYDNGNETLTISAREAPVDVQLQMELRTRQHTEAIRDAFDWGSEANVLDSAFVISGSPAFEHIQRDKAVTAMKIVPEPVWEGSGVLVYHDTEDQLRSEAVDARVSRGTKGLQITATVLSELVTFTLRMESAHTGTARLDVKYDLVRQWTVEQLKRLGPARRVLEAAAAGRAFHLMIEPPGAPKPLEFRWSTDATQELDLALLLLKATDALVRLAGQEEWDLPSNPMQHVSREQMRTIVAAEALARGKPVKLSPTKFSIACPSRPSVDEEKDTFLTVVHGHELQVFLGGDLLGALPAWVMLRNYRWTLEPIIGSERWTIHFIPTEDSTREYFPPERMPQP